MQQYSTKEVSRITKTSLRQLQWWHERGFVHPDVIGHHRYWCHVELTVALNLAALRRRGVAGGFRFIASSVRKWARKPQEPAYLIVGLHSVAVEVGEAKAVQRACRTVEPRAVLRLELHHTEAAQTAAA